MYAQDPSYATMTDEEIEEAENAKAAAEAAAKKLAEENAKLAEEAAKKLAEENAKLAEEAANSKIIPDLPPDNN